MRRRIALAVLLTLVSISQAYAQNTAYPNKPIRWLIPFAPGGGTDVIARPIAQKMGERLGQSILYDNRGGGGGIVAGEIVARLIGIPAVYDELLGRRRYLNWNVSDQPPNPGPVPSRQEQARIRSC